MKPSAEQLKPDDLISEVRDQAFSPGTRQNAQSPFDVDSELLSYTPAADFVNQQEICVQFSGQDNR